MKIKRIHVYLTIVSLCAGFLLSFSYQYTKQTETQKIPQHRYWLEEDQLRETLTEVQKENQELEKQLRDIQQRIVEKEERISVQEDAISATQKELERMRLLAGVSDATGPGVTIRMEDAEYASDAQNPNDYIIHEQDVRRVVNELLAAGAEGISINGQRVTHLTGIRCVGPTIIVNGVKSTAPFEITAVGDSETLYQALYLPGGVVDSLQSWDITVNVEKQNEVIIPAYIGEA
ncbi:DUF881 domain-containing protein [Caldalkalibacillus salinus]|uniref:DUF881 domain-containing protein n=1 Tax=Caldalkalibacillus salinus TaxID=2803787 RepID=UPI001921D396|nr:DUF881 domain-containing protein [Caldalkalibacillus salinus]